LSRGTDTLSNRIFPCSPALSPRLLDGQGFHGQDFHLSRTRPISQLPEVRELHVEMRAGRNAVIYGYH
ncbi:MAG: hypothetical protein LC677_05645, partial [Halomonas sp.]|nr:hypothetical protein [Halomonas sp.]